MSTLPYSESAAGYRKRLPGIYGSKGEGFSIMVTLDQDITLTHESTCFIGRATTGGKIVRVDADNTGGKIMGYLSTGKFENSLIPNGVQKPIDFDQYNLKVGQEYAMFNNPGTQFAVMVDGADDAARKTNAATLKMGATYDLFVDTDGTQKVKITAAGTQLVGIRDLGAGWVLVEISSAAKAM